MSVEFRDRLLRSRGAADQPVGMIVGCSDAGVTEILGRTGYDFVVLDSEHSPMGPAELLPLVRTAQLYGLTPIVRMGEATQPVHWQMPLYKNIVQSKPLKTSLMLPLPACSEVVGSG